MLNLPDHLYREVLEEPEDLDARYRCAEWLEARGDPYGTYIRLTVDSFLHEDDQSSEDYRTWRRLEDKYTAKWLAAVRGLADKAELSRGFVERVDLPARRFLDRAEELFARAPIRHLAVEHAEDCAAELFRSPHLLRMRSLAVGLHLRDAHVEMLVESPHLANVQMLIVDGRSLTERSIELIATTDNLPKLRSLLLADFTDKYREQQIYSDWTDPTGGVWEPPKYARQLEERYGYLPWLHERELNGDFLSWLDL